jgi:hypothetical protein
VYIARLKGSSGSRGLFVLAHPPSKHSNIRHEKADLSDGEAGNVMIINIIYPRAIFYHYNNHFGQKPTTASRFA